ncbi:MAG: hypothetical protein KME28_03105 [Pelatocladus maniniholoensis HA4357-MV3]|jgi:hypothetical protein|uniref:Uncharacterized protein n=1 Tax=Pelatocladus maniniholoensis HA4357-MV3 TaxID=1117104 RepID=A0A9E3H5E5_9NOST|nr:hypothetical protein [Pelatocladus maniniholoensis HA4357-MV3]BAZ70634.1 hypothetical protein NIES4106_54290 [Fischerella sp. NIES-4106]
MYSSLSFAPRNNGWTQRFNRFMNTLALLVPNILLSLIISILGSIILTIFAYGLSAIAGFPVMPFFLIII